MTSANDATEVAVRFARALERAGVEYAVGGSVASSAYGEPRATRDLDFAVRLTPRLVPALLEALGADFVVDVDLLWEGIRTGRSVNLSFDASPTRRLHSETGRVQLLRVTESCPNPEDSRRSRHSSGPSYVTAA